MIYISHPNIEEHEGEVCLASHITNEAEGKEINLFYAVEPEYGRYLCHEQADAFVLPMLLRAVVTAQDIEVDANVSEKLLHNLSYGLIYALAKINQSMPNNYGNIMPYIKKYNNIKEKCPEIKCKGVSALQYGGNAVGTGCSLGVDSFAVIKKYLIDNECFPNYRITHFTCFNVGAFGSFNTKETRLSFKHSVDETKKFAIKLGLPVVTVDTNVHEFYPERDFNWSNTFLNMGCVLALQKLWRKYIYASSIPIEKFEFNIGYSAHSDPFLLPNLSTESTELISGDMEKSRSDKVRYIMNESLVKHNINVCIKEQSRNDGMMKDAENDKHLNCGHCEKCLRTMLQLDILGHLKEYENVFNMSGWLKRKQYYLSKVLACKRKNIMYEDIVNSIPDNYPISIFIRLNSKLYNISFFGHYPFRRLIEHYINKKYI